MTENELVALVQTEVRQSIGYYQGMLAEQRRKAMDYYYGEPYGNEQEGRSRIVTRETMETIEWILPNLMKIFMSGDEIVRFDPQGPEDDQAAAQATDYINYIFQRQNNGFMALYSFFKDALLQKNGFLKVYWQQTNHRKIERYQGLSQLELTFLLKGLDSQEVEYEIQSQDQNPETGRTDIELVITRDAGKPTIEPVAPEEVLINRRADWDIQDARFVCCRTRTNISALREMGFVVDDLRDYSEGEWTLERIARFRYEEDGVYQMHDETDPAMREVWLVEAYPKVDFDGDGIAERRICHIVGNQLLRYQDGTPANFEIERVPLVTCTPCPMPHKLFGLSLADLTMDLQMIKSTVLRQILDNMYLANNSRMMVLDGMANIDDLLSVRPGGIVRVKTFQAVQPLTVPLLGAPAFELLEYLDTVRENRTGVTKYNQGLDADSLNKTAQGINQIMSASQQRLELVARIFAETGVKDLFWAILELVQKHSSQPQTMRLRGQWTTVDPREWDTRFDMSVSVGLGTGSHAAQLAGLQLIGQIQQALNAGGLGGLVVTPQNAYNFALDAARAVNPRRATMYFTDPQGQMPQPQVSPAAASLQKAQMQNQTKQQLGGMHVALEAAKIKAQSDQHDKKLAHETSMQALDMVSQAFAQAGAPQQPPAGPPTNPAVP